MTGHHHSRRFRRTAIQVALIAAVAGLAPPAAAGSDDAQAILRVRSSDPSLTALIDRAVTQSGTFQRLVSSVQRSNGIVYVEAGTCSHAVRACLKMWMATAGPNRFLRIVIDRRRTDSDESVMAFIGHELQHAIEGLSESGTSNGARLYSFFSRSAPMDEDRFETTAALRAGDDVQDELRGLQRAVGSGGTRPTLP